MTAGGWRAALTIVALSLLAKPGEESLAVATSIKGAGRGMQRLSRTSRAVWGITLACVDGDGTEGQRPWLAGGGRGR